MTPEESLDFHLKRTWLLIAKMYNQIAQQYDLSQATGFVLMHIDDEAGSPSTSIAPLLGMEVTSMSRLLNSMEDKGLIVRKQDKEDKRMVRIFLTDEGKEKRKIARRVVKQFNELITAELGESVVQSTIQILERVSELAEESKQEILVEA